MSTFRTILSLFAPSAMGQRSSQEASDVQKYPRVHRNDPGSTVLAYLLAGPLTLGGIGYGVDRWLGTGFLTPIGILVGVVLAIYIIILRFGRS